MESKLSLFLNIPTVNVLKKGFQLAKAQNKLLDYPVSAPTDPAFNQPAFPISETPPAKMSSETPQVSSASAMDKRKVESLEVSCREKCVSSEIPAPSKC